MRKANIAVLIVIALMLSEPIIWYAFQVPDPASIDKSCRETIAENGIDEVTNSATYATLLQSCYAHYNAASNFRWGRWAVRSVIFLSIALFIRHKVSRRNEQRRVEEMMRDARDEGRYHLHNDR